MYIEKQEYLRHATFECELNVKRDLLLIQRDLLYIKRDLPIYLRYAQNVSALDIKRDLLMYTKRHLLSLANLSAVLAQTIASVLSIRCQNRPIVNPRDVNARDLSYIYQTRPTKRDLPIYLIAFLAQTIASFLAMRLREVCKL